MAIYSDYVAAAILYNIQILPESVLTGLILLAIVLANPVILALAGGVGGTQLITGAIGRLVMKYLDPGAATLSSSMDACTGGFISQSWGRLLRGTANADYLWHPKAPSVFQATIGFLAGYGVALQSLYTEEIRAGVLQRSHMVTATVVTALLVALAVLFRVASGCETLLSALGGVALGFLLGYAATITLGYATNRRLTNIWGIPLLRDRINNGSALYVCGL